MKAAGWIPESHTAEYLADSVRYTAEPMLTASKGMNVKTEGHTPLVVQVLTSSPNMCCGTGRKLKMTDEAIGHTLQTNTLSLHSVNRRLPET